MLVKLRSAMDTQQAHRRSAESGLGRAGRKSRLAALFAGLLLSVWMGGVVAQKAVGAGAPVALPPVVPVPGPGRLIVSCDPGGCWDEFGVRYDRADATVFVRVDGRSCLMIKGRMHCA